jgi:hypothetical protein
MAPLGRAEWQGEGKYQLDPRPDTGLWYTGREMDGYCGCVRCKCGRVLSRCPYMLPRDAHHVYWEHECRECREDD